MIFMKKSVSVQLNHFVPLLLLVFALIALYYHNRYRSVQLLLAELDPGPFSVELIKEHYPLAESIRYEKGPRDASEVVDKDGNILIYALDSRPFSDNIIGYAGPVPLLILFDSGQVIQKVILLENDETESFIRRIENAGFLSNWEGVALDDTDGKVFDAVSMATMSSDAISESLLRRVAVYVGDSDDQRQSSAARASVIILLPILLLIITRMFPRSFAGFKWIPQLVSLFTLGVLTATMLSISVFRGWLYHGFQLSTQWPIIALGFTVLGFLLIKKQNIYCPHICPYGILQVFAARIPVKRIKFSANVSSLMSQVRSTMLLLFFILLLIVETHDPALFEPFAAFRPSAVPLYTLVLALFFVAISAFIPRLWCRMFCPTGKCLDLLRGK